MEMLCFITDGSAELEKIHRSLETMLNGICPLPKIRLEDACTEKLPQGIVLPYRECYAENESFRMLAQIITERFSREDALDHRIYIFPTDMTEEAFLDLLNMGEDSALAVIGDVVQITADRDLSALKENIRDYLSTWEDARRVRQREALLHRLQFYIGWAGWILMGISMLISVICIAPQSVSPEKYPQIAPQLKQIAEMFSSVPFLIESLSWIYTRSDILIPLTWFTGLIMVIAVLVRIFQNGLFAASNDYERIVCYPPDVFVLSIILVVSCIQMFAPIIYRGRFWFLFPAGVLLAAGLDSLRRLRFTGKRFRRFQSLDKSMSTGTEHAKLSAWLRNSGRRPIADALRKPYFRKNRIRIFVSYTHASPWSSWRVNELYRICREEGIECFVDREEIPRGASWRRSIFAGLLVADYFIAFEDSKSVLKQWPAAELEMALALRAISGAPAPIVFVPQDFPYKVTKDYLPVFRDTMTCSAEPDFFVRVIWYSSGAMQTLIRKSIMKREAKSPTSLFIGSYEGKAEDRRLEKEAYRNFEVLNRMRRLMTAKMIEKGASSNAELETRYGICSNVNAMDPGFLRRFTGSADTACEELLPRKAYPILMEAVQAAVLLGRPETIAKYCRKTISTLYGSMLSDYSLYVEIHRIEYIAAFAYEKMGDRKNALIYVERCLSGLESVYALRQYFFKGFELDKRASLLGHGVTVLPLSFKMMTSTGFPDIVPKAEELRRKLRAGLKPNSPGSGLQRPSVPKQTPQQRKASELPTGWQVLTPGKDTDFKN